jgi:hypothetical protein
MNFYHLNKLLLLIWQLSTVYSIPIIIYTYVSIMNSNDQPFSFAELDQGQNPQKLTVVGIYLIYLLIWKLSNKAVINFLDKLKHR